MNAPTYTPKARADLRSVIRSSRRMFGRLQARRYADQIEAAGIDLVSGLRKGRVFDTAYPEHLRFRVGSHYLVYRVDAAGGVNILRVFHVRMNVVDHLSSP